MSNEVVLFDPSSDRSRPGVLASVRAHHRLIVLGLTLGLLLGFTASFFLPTSYTAQASFYLGEEKPFKPNDSDSGGDPVRFAADQAELVTTTEVLQEAGNAVVPPVPVEDVRDSVSAVPSSDTSRVTVTVVRPEAEQAKALADAVVNAYRDRARQRVDSAVSAAKAATNDPTIARDVDLLAAAYGDGVVATEPAVLPRTASAPLPLQNSLLGGLFGVVVATVWVVVSDQRRARQASVTDLDVLLGAPLLTRCSAPASRTGPEMVDTSPHSDRVRAGHDLLTAIDVALEGNQHPVVLFLSWQRALTTTSLVVSSALAAARANRSVVVVDGGMKEYGISSLTDVDPGRGLEALANPNVPVDASLRTWQIGKTLLSVIPIDGWTPATSGSAARPQVLRAAVARLQETASLVLVDGPPLTERSLGLALGRGVDGVVLVIDEETSVDDAHEMGRRISLAGVTVIGYVLVGDRSRRMSWSPHRADEGPLSLISTPTPHRR